MMLLKVFVVLSALLVVSSYGHSQRVGGRGRAPKKWTAADRDWTPMHHSSKLARIKYWYYHYVPEVKYRLDEVPCSGAVMPPENEAYHYYAPVRYVWYIHSYHCYTIKLPKSQGILGIPTDMDPFYTLQSPGSNNNYPPQRLSYYRITCPGLIQFSVQEFYLQDKIRISYNQKKCVDYVKITDLSDSSITREFCGMLAPITESYTDDVLVTFRTSKYNNYPGFTIYAYCNNSTQIMGNCLEVENSEYAAGQTIDKWTRKSVPKYALRELRAFLRSREQGGDVWIMSDEEAVWNADMLSLAVLSEHSCAAEYRRAGKAVLEVFPKWMVKKERETFKKDAVFNT